MLHFMDTQRNSGIATHVKVLHRSARENIDKNETCNFSGGRYRKRLLELHVSSYIKKPRFPERAEVSIFGFTGAF